MKSISIGRSKVTEFQVDKILSGEKVNKVMSIWDKIKDLFNIGDKKQVLTLLYDVYYNPEVSLLDKLDKFKELTRLSLNDFHNDFSIEIEKGTFYFEIIKTEGDSINDRLIISQFLYENECDITNLYKNQSVSFLFNKSSENEIENLNKMIKKKDK
ncbi:hypothetical protein I4550_04515 [Proteus mirabilis]|nr:hypothetical protein [Proteus mirabilis]